MIAINSWYFKIYLWSISMEYKSEVKLTELSKFSIDNTSILIRDPFFLYSSLLALNKQIEAFKLHLNFTQIKVSKLAHKGSWPLELAR